MCENSHIYVRAGWRDRFDNTLNECLRIGYLSEQVG